MAGAGALGVGARPVVAGVRREPSDGRGGRARLVRRDRRRLAAARPRVGAGCVLRKRRRCAVVVGEPDGGVQQGSHDGEADVEPALHCPPEGEVPLRQRVIRGPWPS
jgi:hypothetical protein